MEPGIYISRQGEPDFGEALALIETGQVRSLGVRYEQDGRRAVAFEVGAEMQSNPEDLPEADIPEGAEDVEIGVVFGQEFFSKVLEEYKWNFGEKWWREAIQNAVDAGARNIICSTEHIEDEQVLVTCDDDGSGMTYEVLQSAVLTAGGTTKRGHGKSSFGGFGRAKELLLFPWIKFRIHTRDLVYESSALVRAKPQRAPLRKGTRLQVWMPQDKYATSSDAIAYIRKCNLPGIEFTVDGKQYPADTGRNAEEVRRFEYEGERGKYSATVTTEEENDNYPYHALIRLNGLYMFEKWTDGKPPSLVTIELRGSAIDMLTSNRDAFSAQQLERDVEGFVRELAIERKHALQRKQKLFTHEYVGGERFQAEKIERAAQETARLLEATRAQDDAEKVLDSMQESMQQAARQHEAQVLDASLFIAKAQLSGVELLGSDHVEAVAKLLAWTPDYLVRNEIPGFDIPKRFMPETMTSEVRKLVKLWTELCRFVMMQVGCGKQFGVGVVFSADALAMYERRKSEVLGKSLDWLLLNPIMDIRGQQVPGNALNYADDHVLLDIYARAVHECTHMESNVSAHDVDFAVALTRNMALTYGRDKQVRAIRRGVAKYDAEERERLREAKGKPPREPEKPSKPVTYEKESDSYTAGTKRPAGWDRVRVYTTFDADRDPMIVAVFDSLDEPPQHTRMELLTWDPGCRTGKPWYWVAFESNGPTDIVSALEEFPSRQVWGTPMMFLEEDFMRSFGFVSSDDDYYTEERAAKHMVQDWFGEEDALYAVETLRILVDNAVNLAERHRQYHGR